jgi:hypothetical protein
MLGQIVVVGPEIAGVPAVVVEGSGVKSDGPMNMPEHSAPPAATPSDTPH